MTNDDGRAGGVQDEPDDSRAELEELADLFADLAEVEDGSEALPEHEQRSKRELTFAADGSMAVHVRKDGSVAGMGALSREGWTQAASADVPDAGLDAIVEALPAGMHEGVGSSVDLERVNDGGRREVVPGWVWDRRAVVPWVGRRVGDGVVGAGFHVVRSPWYALRGLAGLVRGVGGWVWRAEDDEQFAADLKAAGSLRARGKVRGDRARGRFFRMAFAASPLAAVWVWLEHGGWGVLPASVCVGGYVGLVVAGWRRIVAERTPRERAVMRRKVMPLSRPFVSEALATVGCGVVKLPSGAEQGPIIWSSSPTAGGELMVIDLPPGYTVSRLLKAHEDFAGALGRPAECVVIEPQPKVSPQRFELFVASKLLEDKGSPAWAWSKGGRRSFFDGVPVGVDARGRLVVVPLFERHGLIGGATGYGKTNSARLVAMGAFLDPRVIGLIHNLKGGADYRPFAGVAHTLRSGDSPADFEALITDLVWIQGEVARRGRVLESMPLERVPKSKLTEDIASDAGMGPILLLIDEPQRAFASKRYGAEIAERLEDIVRTSRSVGVSVQLVTNATKAGVIPAGIMDQCTSRIGHGVSTIGEANIILGSDAHGRTHRAVDIEVPGVAYVGSVGGAMVKTAMSEVELPEADRIMQGAADMRREAGTLSGMAAGEIPADEHEGGSAAFLADVLKVWPAEDGRPWKNVKSDRLAALLALAMPDEYGDLEDETGGAEVSRRMKAAGVKVSSQRTPAGDGRGVKRSDVVRAASAGGRP